MLVYVGAVMVLFLFVVMLDSTPMPSAKFLEHLPLAGLVGALIALEMALVLLRGFPRRFTRRRPLPRQDTR